MNALESTKTQAAGMTAFDFHPQTRIVGGEDAIDQLGELAKELQASRVLLVSDPGIVEAGHTLRGQASLEAAALETQIFSAIRENPTTEDVERGLKIAQGFAPNLIVGLGGGSSMDCAKGINFLFSCGGRMQDYWGVGKANAPMLPMIAVPTTTGTGSESQSFALISDAETGQKMACGDKKAAFRIAILDPKLTVTQPPTVTAVTGLDAVSHAVESFVCRRRNPLSNLFALQAWDQLTSGFPLVLENPNDLQGRAMMQLGACYAGLAIENAMLGAAHALANPLTAKYKIVHGQAVGLMLPHVVQFNATTAEPQFRELAERIPDDGQNHATGADAVIAFLTELLIRTGLKTRLQELKVPEEDLPALALDAEEQWTGNFNPRPVDQSALFGIYQAAF